MEIEIVLGLLLAVMVLLVALVMMTEPPTVVMAPTDGRRL
jgi:hypothetical protein